MGSLNTISDGVGTLTRAELNQLAGTASTITDGVGALSSLYQLAGIASTLTNGTAAIGSFPALAGLANTISDSTGALTRAELKLLAGNGITVSDGALTVLVAKSLLAQGNTVSDGTAQLDTSGGTTVNIAGSANTVTDGTATLAKLAALAATAATVSDGTATFSKLDDITGTAATVSNGTGAFGVSQLPPSDALMTLLWHSELGIGLTSGDVQTWTDQLQGVVVSAAGAANRPAYGADGTNFQSRNVVQLNKAGPKYLLVTGASGFPLSGTRPYIVTGFRYRSLASGGSTDSVWAFYENTTARIFARLVDLGGGSLDFKLRYPTSATELDITPSSVGTAVSIHECWGDGTLLHSRVDGVDTTLSSSATLAANLNSVYFGYTGAGLFQTNATLAYVLVFSAKPSDPYIATLRAWSASYFGTPP